jgi:hypothetical protein
MKAKITAKTDLQPDLTRYYTFDVIDDNEEIIMRNQSVQCRPSEAAATIQGKVAEVAAQYEAENDVEVDEVING